jgi:hypothetical protein
MQAPESSSLPIERMNGCYDPHERDHTRGLSPRAPRFLHLTAPLRKGVTNLESRKIGIAEAKLRALLDYERSVLFTQEEGVVLRYAEAMTQTPLRVPDDLFEALKASYSERQIVELTYLIAWENCVARFNHALGIEADGVSGDASCLLPIAHHSRDERL